MAHRGDIEQRIEPADRVAGDGQRLRSSAPTLRQASAENALGAFLADTDQFRSSRADARHGVIVVGLERFPQRHTYAGHTPDDRMMASPKVVAADLIEQLELRSCSQANQDRQTTATCLQAGLTQLTRHPECRGQLINGDQVLAISHHCSCSRFASKRKIDMRQTRNDMLVEECTQASFIVNLALAHHLLEAEGMRIGSGRKRRVGNLQQRGQPVGSWLSDDAHARQKQLDERLPWQDSKIPPPDVATDVSPDRRHSESHHR
jgi:hypothetical protein